MHWKSIFKMRGTNYWILALSVAANLLWSFFVLVIAFIFDRLVLRMAGL